MSSPLGQLVLMRLRMFWREPGGLFWMFMFPLLATAVLGLAFRSQEPGPVAVAVLEAEGSEGLRAQLSASPQLAVHVLPEAQARAQLRKGEVALLVAPGPQPRLIEDPGQGEGRAAALLVREVLARAGGAPGLPELPTTRITEPGSRFVDFFVPGLLGYSLLNTSLAEMAFVLVQMRNGRLLKRLAATPLRKHQLLGSFLLVRGLIALVEITFYGLMARYVFDVPMRGAYLVFGGVALVGACSFSGLAMLVASRVKTPESASGLGNLITLPMAFLSGVFFSAQRFPEWMQPALSLLPLSALNDALRSIMLDGVGPAALVGPLCLLAVWGAVPFVVSLRLFRWQ